MANENEMVNLVLARLSVMPENIKLHMGSSKRAFDKADLIEHVKKQDELGRQFVHLQIEYIKATIKGFVL